MADDHKTVFISYRRSESGFIARAIFSDLRTHRYDVFMDVENIDSGVFSSVILNQIEARAHFIIILTPGTLKRCAEPDDWLRREIEYAIDKGRNIVPIFVSGFTYDDQTKPYLTDKLTILPSLNGLNVYQDYFDEGMTKLRRRFLKQPVVGALKPAPVAEQPIVDKKIENTASQPAPTQEQLSAEEYFNRAYSKYDAGDYDGTIADYTEALRLNPDYADAYNNRGVAYDQKGDLDAALADYTRSIELDNPELHLPYGNRARLYAVRGDFEAALADYNQAIRLAPENADYYMSRGVAYRNRGDYDAAIADYLESTRLNPNNSDAYNDLGDAHYHQGDYDAAIADFTKAISLDPDSADPLSNRGEANFASGRYAEALADFRQANNLRPAFNMTLGSLAITDFALGNKAEAQRLWRALLAQDKRYTDAEWVGREFHWQPKLTEAARQLIASL